MRKMNRNGGADSEVIVMKPGGWLLRSKNQAKGREWEQKNTKKADFERKDQGEWWQEGVDEEEDGSNPSRQGGRSGLGHN